CNPFSNHYFKAPGLTEDDLKLGQRLCRSASQLTVKTSHTSHLGRLLLNALAVFGEVLSAGCFLRNLRRLLSLHKLVGQIAISRPLIGAVGFDYLNDRVD